MASITDLFTAMQNAVTAINTLNQTLTSKFPQTTAGSTIAPTASVTGTITFTSSQATGFMVVTTSSGFSAKVPYYG